MSPPADSRRPRNLALFALAAVGALTLAWRFTRSPRAPVTTTHSAPSAAPTRFSGQCRFDADEVRAYTIEQAFTQGSHPVTHTRTTLALKADAASDGVTPLTAVLVDVETDDEVLRELATRPIAFVVRIARDCHFEGIGFSHSTAPALARKIRGIVRTFEVKVPTAGDARTWSVVQHDDHADLRVRYTVLSGDAGTGIERSRERYLPRTREDTALPIMVSSSALFTLAPDERWLDRLEGTERVRGLQNNPPELDLTHHFTLARTVATWPSIAAPSDPDFNEPEERADAPRLSPDDPSLSLDTTAAIAHLRDLYAHRQNGAADEAVTFLTSWLEAHPERAAELLHLIRARSYPEDLGALTFFVMSRVRSPVVRDALTAAVQDDGYAARERLRAAVALGDSPMSNADSVAALDRVARARTSADDSEVVTDGALNSIGIIASHSTGATSEAALTALQSALDRARTPETMVDALDAISNSRSARFREAAAQGLQSDSPRVRQSAANAVGYIGGEGAETALRARLATETVPEVIARIAAALLEVTRRRPSHETAAVAASRLADVDDVAARVALIDLIGAAAATDPAARAALIAWYAQERDGRVLVAIGRYVRAEELAPRR